jgi:hypothetical protein
MSGRAAPATRWAVPPPWTPAPVAVPPVPRPKIAAKRASKCFSADQCTGTVLLGLLERDLVLGNHRVALRHFLMAQACGMQPPRSVQKRCEELLRTTSQQTRDRIECSVNAWAKMFNGLLQTGAHDDRKVRQR